MTEKGWPSKLRSSLWVWVGIAFAFFTLWMNAYMAEATFLRFTRAPHKDQAWDASMQWGAKEHVLRPQPTALMDNDCYYWIRYAQEMVEKGVLRVRFTTLDNTPDGREVHWSSLYSWLLIAAGAVHSLFAGEGLLRGIEDGAVWVNTALHAVILAGVAWAVTRRVGGLAAGVLVFMLAYLPGLSWALGYGRPGHHGLQALGLLGDMLCLLLAGLGWVRAPGKSSAVPAVLPLLTFEQARKWFVAAGLFGALGLWIGATIHTVALAAVGLGALLSSYIAHENVSSVGVATWDGRLWRYWGIAGCLGSLAAFLIEYFPSYLFAMRLEVNHPLHALAFLAGGEILARSGSLWSWQGWKTKWPWFVGCGALAALLPLAVLAGPPEWHSLRDPYMRRLHDGIANFQPFMVTVGEKGLAFALFREYGLLPLAIPLFLVSLVRGRRSRPLSSAMIFVLPPALVLIGWQMYQNRWGNLAAPALAMVLLVSLWWASEVAQSNTSPPWIRILAPAFAALLFLPSFFFWLTTLLDVPKARAIPEMHMHLARMLATRDAALSLSRYEKVLGQVRVMSAPTETPTLHYFGNVRGTGSLYWENIPGVRDAADFFAATDEAEAQAIAKRRGLHFVMIAEDPNAASEAAWVKSAIKDDAEIMKTLAYRISVPGGTDIPKWLEPVPYYSSPLARAFRLRLYRIRLPD